MDTQCLPSHRSHINVCMQTAAAAGNWSCIFASLFVFQWSIYELAELH